MRRREDFAEALRGVRLPCGPVVLHLSAPDEESDRPALVGLAVSRGVGSSVVRHRVARRLRHQLRPRLERLPRGSRIVVRALPAAATASSAELAAAIDRGLERAHARGLVDA